MYAYFTVSDSPVSANDYRLYKVGSRKCTPDIVNSIRCYNFELYEYRRQVVLFIFWSLPLLFPGYAINMSYCCALPESTSFMRRKTWRF